MDNVIRQDVVKIDFKTNDALSALQKLQSEIDKLKSSFNALNNKSDGLDKVKKSADGTKKSVQGTTSATDKMKNSVQGTTTAADKMKSSVSDTTSATDKMKSSVKGTTAETDKMKKSVKDTTSATEKMKAPLDKAKKTDFTKLKKGLSDVNEKLKSIGSKAGVTAFNTLKKIAGLSIKGLTAGLAAAGTAVGGLVTKSVSAYADYEQLVGGVDTLFKDSSGTVQRYANDAFKTAGLSANAYMENVTSFSASLIQSVGGDTKKAADLAHMAMVDMSDNANKMGSDIGSIQDAYQGFAKQNYTMLDNLKLGYGGTATEMARLLNDSGVLEKKINLADSKNIGNAVSNAGYSKIVEAIHVIQTQMDIAGTTQKEAATTISGSLNMVKSAWGNLLPSLIQGGDSFDQCLDNLIESASTFGEQIIPALEKSLSGIGVLIERTAPIIEKEFPKLVNTLLPPLLKAATALLNGFVKALPSIIKTIVKELPSIIKQLGQAIIDAFGINAPILGKVGKFFTQNSKRIAKFIPVVLGLVGAFKLFKFFKGLELPDLFGGKKGGKGSKKGGLFDGFKALAKTDTKTILKGMANLGIIVGGLTILAGLMMLVAPKLSKMSDVKSLAKVIGVIGVLGLVGTGLSWLAGKVGVIPVSAVAKGLANIAVVIGGMSVLYAVVGAVSLLKFSAKSMLKVVALIGVIGVVGSGLSALAGIVGLIPTLVVAKGLANIAIVMGGMGALLFAATKVFSNGINFRQMFKVVALIGILGVVGSGLTVFAGIVGLVPTLVVVKGIANIGIVIGGLGALLFATTKVFSNGINFKQMFDVIKLVGILGTVGSVLSVFAGVAGLVPFPLVVSGLASIATVIAGLTGIIVAFGKIAEIPKFNEFVTTGGDTLAKIFNQIGRIGGSLAGGIGEGISNSLPAIGENIAQFATNLKPLFTMFKGVDMSGAGTFFSSLGGFMLKMAGNDLVSFFTGGTDLSAFGNQLSSFADSAQGFFTKVATFPENGFKNAKLLFQSLSDIGNVPKTGGLVQWFGGETDYASLAVGLRQLSSPSIVGFYNTANTIPEEAFEKAKLLFQSLSDIGKLPKTGGLMQWFTGETDLMGIASKLPSFGSAMALFYANISGIGDFTIATKLFDAIAKISSLPKEGGLFGWAKGKVNLADIGSQLTTFANNASTFFEKVNTLKADNLNVLLNALKELGTVITSVQTAATTDFKTMLTNIKTSCDAIIDTVNTTVTSLQTTISGTDLSAAGSAMMNTLLTGINSKRTEILTAAGSIATAIKAKFSNINANVQFGVNKIGTFRYANGTNGHKGGNAVVNDGRGAELVQMPNGNTFIPQGKNVFMPNAPKGMKVLSAENTAKLFGRSTPTFNYADGTGNISVYTPERDAAVHTYASRTETNNYNPVFNLTINGNDTDARTMERKVRRWVKESIEDTFDTMNRKKPRLQQV
ncbi:hypothetical protein [Ruminococcus sp.]|uniref:hypothetical protein n=1 Tax=Ruminococcus sp. TaxID=41978 RepID=UPI00260AECF1|nr:hypothetical protein [Ruminococcus sp.]MDD6988775.1 hypothetical protein [Ruminococcus sp.]